MKKIKLLIALSLYIPFILSTGCTRPNIPISQDFYKEDGDIALVWAAEAETGLFNRKGAQGLLDMLVNDMTKGTLPEYVSTIELQPLVEEHYIPPYSKKLADEGFKVNVIKLPLDKKALGRAKNVKKDKAPRDFSSLHHEHEVEYVVYLDIKRFEIAQEFYGTIPLGAPYANTELDIYLINVPENVVVAVYRAKKSIKPEGKWDNPPEYPEVTAAILKSLKEALEEAYLGFFDIPDSSTLIETK